MRPSYRRIKPCRAGGSRPEARPLTSSRWGGILLSGRVRVASPRFLRDEGHILSWHALLVLGVSLLVMAEMAKFWQLPWPPTGDEILAQWWVRRELLSGGMLLAGGIGFLVFDIVRVVSGTVEEAREFLWADLAIIGAFVAIVLHKLRTAKVFVTVRGVWFADRQFHGWERFHPMEIEAGALRERAFLGLKVTIPAALQPRVRELYRQALEAQESTASGSSFAAVPRS